MKPATGTDCITRWLDFHTGADKHAQWPGRLGGGLDQGENGEEEDSQFELHN